MRRAEHINMEAYLVATQACKAAGPPSHCWAPAEGGGGGGGCCLHAQLMAQRGPGAGGVQVAEGVAGGTTRPTLPKGLPPGLEALAQQAWHGNPALRPSFAAIVDTLTPLATEVAPPPLNPELLSLLKIGNGLPDSCDRTAMRYHLAVLQIAA